MSDEVSTPAGTQVAPSARVAVPRGRELDKVIKRAEKGDEGCLPQVRALLDDDEEGPWYLEHAGSPAEWLRRSLVDKMAGKHLVAKEAARKKLDAVQATLEGPNPAPIERLLAERAAFCWFTVSLYEERFVNRGEMSIAQAECLERRVDRAHRRFLSAVETLARVRKLAVPSLMVNIAKNQQVNVGETRE
jgi:hypothetical protein